MTPVGSTLAEVVLTADLSEVPVDWIEVAEIPFGPGEDELFFVDDPNVSPLPQVPTSFAVDGDGSFWILDRSKKRLAHFSPSGEYLGSIGGLRADRFHPFPRDVAMVGSRLWVLHHFMVQSTIIRMGSQGPETATLITDGDRPLVVVHLFPTMAGMVGLIGGFAVITRESPGDVGGGPHGFAVLDPPESALPRFLPGIPVGTGTWIDLGGRDQDFTVTYTREGASAVQPLRIEVIPSPGAEPVPAIAGPGIEAALDGAAVYWVQVSPSEPENQERYGGGRWYLELGPEGRPMAWERMPDPGISDETQTRHLTVGPDGRVYLMVMQPEGVVILRRDPTR